MLMRNLDAPRLYNGTQLQITHQGHNIVRAIIITRTAKGENVLTSRIPIIPTDLPFQFKRVQFSLKAAFAITINKVKGKKLKVAGVHLEKKKLFFPWATLCSMLASVGSQNLHVLAKDENSKNIVYKNVLN